MILEKILMKKNLFPLILLLALTSTCLAVPDFIGDWRGKWIDPPKGYLQLSPELTAQVIGLGDDRYQVTFREEFERRATPIFIGTGTSLDGVIEVAGEGFSCRITESSIRGQGLYRSKTPVPFELQPFFRVSPTMNRPAPEGAVLLFDGTSLDQWKHIQKGKEIDPVWKIHDGILRAVPKKENNEVGGDLVSRRVFKSCELHLEFRLPYEPGNSGQGRANSGVFFQGTYEVQILDSYGLTGDWTECGALYKVAPPKVNRCSPPGQWQTYDIIFDAAVYDADGNLLKNPVVTVCHNGELIHNQQELFEVTQYMQANRLKPHPKEAGPIELQDHGHPVEYRNIWLVER